MKRLSTVFQLMTARGRKGNAKVSFRLPSIVSNTATRPERQLTGPDRMEVCGPDVPAREGDERDNEDESNPGAGALHVDGTILTCNHCARRV
jgi:hypothetical protein